MPNVPNNVFTKDPSAKKTYAWDWDLYLDPGEEITEATITVPADVVLVAQVDTARKIFAKLSGGTARTRPRVRCHIKTNMDNEDTRSIYLKCDLQ